MSFDSISIKAIMSYMTNSVALVDLVFLVVVVLVKLIGKGSNLSDASLVCNKIALESLVLCY